MNKERLVPQLRFKGFEGEWEKKTFGDVFNYERPDKYIVDSDEYDTVGTPVLTANKSFVLGYTHEDGAYDKGDSVIFDDFTLDSKYVDFNYKVKSSALKILTAKQGNLRYLYELLASTHINQEGHSRHYISVVQPFKIKVAPLDEQQKIGSFFEKMDKLIEFYKSNIQNKILYKKSILQKIIPRQESGFARLRFNYFSDKWNSKKIKNIADILDNKRVPITASKRENGKIPYYGANGIQDYVKNYTHEGFFTLIAEDGASDVLDYPVYYVEGKIWVNNHAHVLSGKNHVADTRFLSVILKCVDYSKYVTGGGRKKLNGNVLKTISIKIPSLPEQQKIGQLFQKLDQEINLYEQKIEQLKQLKKGYLQKLFC
ncbi:restriction endonuclease subunit S [Holzapfeliella sp. He02]|uniref:Restriction endonuclease subunit S n=1 Tax=Holzapfeliella saturejae TaxID=3082953 RepID=A0ABU8SE87_9LACO